jgi:hypothetical protein
VDIDPGAVEIAKLRLWLSLVVDEEDIKNIKPLPNLDYKIVCGNSLLSVEKNLLNFQLFDELEKLKPLFFKETNPTQKQKYKKQIDNLISQITKGNAKFDFEVYFSEVFHEKGGFDVVIANPPYKEEILPRYLNKIYKTYKTKELYAYFFEKSIYILKKSGGISFITGSIYLKGIKFEALREFLTNNLYNVQIKQEGDKVFENVQMPTSVLIGLKGDKNNWKFENIIEGYSIVEKVEQQSLALDKLTYIQRGLEIGKDKTFTHNKNYVPIITGSDISKWTVKRIRFIKRSTYQNYKKDHFYYAGKRILIRETGEVILCVLLNEEILNNRSIYSIKISDKILSYETLIGILNSKLIQYYYSFKFKTKTSIFPKIRIAQVKKIPIKIPPNYHMAEYSFFVNEILFITKDDDYLQNPAKQAQVKQYEKQIDRMVYELYGLTDEEIKIVEGEAK